MAVVTLNTNVQLSGKTIVTEEGTWTITGAWTFTANPTFASGLALASPVLTTPQIQDTSANHQYVFAVSELAADRTVTWPLLTGNDQLTFDAHATTLTNKTIDWTSNTMSLTSAEMRSACSDETGTGSLVFATSPTLVTPALGTPSALVGTNVTGVPIATGLAVGTKANLETRLSDVADLAEADGDVYSGVHDFGATTSLEIPNSGSPTVNATGEIALDTSIADHTPLILFYDGTEEQTIVSMPSDQRTATGGHIISYNASDNEFEMVAPAKSGLTLIATAAASSNEYNFSSLTPTAGAPLFLYIAGGETSTDDDDINMQLNGVTSSSYRFGVHGHSDAGGTGAWSSMSAAHIAIIGENGSTNAVGNAAGEQFHAAIWISNTHDANEFLCSGRTWWLSGGAQAYEASVVGHADLGSDTGITAIKIFAGGNIDAGVAYLYEVVIA